MVMFEVQDVPSYTEVGKLLCIPAIFITDRDEQQYL